ncbi:MAG TPA: exodeoxyribonuclease VII small subunit [Methanomicrobiales archaeon]|jgi:exodeoxyribonuclease VII small subunit|nr:exodeoxyribonuclease VII small subunit [Methanomicrobiales archaeon]
MSRKFEEMLEELKEVVKKMEDPDTGLDESIALYEKGAALIRECERKLADAELKVTEVTEK